MKLFLVQYYVNPDYNCKHVNFAIVRAENETKVKDVLNFDEKTRHPTGLRIRVTNYLITEISADGPQEILWAKCF